MKASTLISTQSRRRLAPRHALTCLSFQSPGPPAHPPRHQASTSACSPRKHPSAARRSFHRSAAASSDNLLGYSPMAKSAPSKPAAQTPSQGAVWGVDSNTAGGGVWAQTSAKKDKLNELLTELNGEGVDTGRLGMESLDLAANSEQKLDLEFADGLKFVAKCVDSGMSPWLPVNNSDNNNNLSPHTQAMQTTSLEAEQITQQLFQVLSNAKEQEWTRPKFEATMKECVRILSAVLSNNTTESIAGRLDLNSPLCYIRDFVDDKAQSSSDEQQEQNQPSTTSEFNPQLQTQLEALQHITTQAFSTSIDVYKVLLLRALATTLLENWDQLTSITSGDIDRAAVNHDGKGAIPSTRETVNVKAVQQLFEAYQSSSCDKYVESWWNLVDADQDGLIDQEEMNAVVELAMKPVHFALKDMVDASLQVCPVRRIGSGKNKHAWFLGDDDISSLDTNVTNPAQSSSKLSWRHRRTEQGAQKLLTKTFSNTLSRHFRDQVETPHRLRCIYAWADKGHQNNKIDSILVDASEDWGAASSIVGKKRYVELEPKISYNEFRDVQRKHFPQLDNMGAEIVMSFKEDLWVLQGKGRQNAELRRDCFLFLGAVSLIDVGIGLL